MCNKTFEQKKLLNGLGMAGRRKRFDLDEKKSIAWYAVYTMEQECWTCYKNIMKRVNLHPYHKNDT